MRQMAIWIDHEEARVFQVSDESFKELTIPAPTHHVHRHPKDQETRSHNHAQDEVRFFGDVVRALEGADEVLVMGPSVTKLHFFRHAQQHAPALAARVVGMETADHPTDRQLVAHVRHYFHIERPRLGHAP